jgi:alpha-L-fucosidase
MNFPHKHHDGFAMYRSKVSLYNTVDAQDQAEKP